MNPLSSYNYSFTGVSLSEQQLHEVGTKISVDYTAHLKGKTVYRGTSEKYVASTIANTENRGQGFGGNGLYLAFDDTIAKDYAGSKLGGKGVVMKGTIQAENMRVGKIIIAKRGTAHDLSKGIFPADWSKDPKLQKYLNDHFDALLICNLKSAGYAIDSDEYVVIHSRPEAEPFIKWDQEPKLNTPAKENFRQLVQQKGLTESYNSSNPNNPISEQAGISGDIGGVACSSSYIEGLFDSPEALFEPDHYFCMPTVDGQPPFSDNELRQILRELAIGIYTDSTVPFFSLHFNQEGDLVPVIHPTYKHTLVGRIISMLDYFMKGYLNGGVFEEDFIYSWAKDPEWNSLSSFQKVIRFTDYCAAHLDGNDKKYVSLRLLSALMPPLEKVPLSQKDERILNDFSGFSNSFRIIAKQKSIQKENGLFVIDADFDVLYTIKPSPEYKEALERYVREHKIEPLSHQNMIKAYDQMCLFIHDHMVKMPLCRHYFAMLGVINFFSGYFSTLKKHGKIPILPVFETRYSNGCPALFPHLPVETISTQEVKANLHKIWEAVKDDKCMRKYLKEMLNQSCEMTSEENLLTVLSSIILENMEKSYSPSFRRVSQIPSTKNQLQDFAKKSAASLLDIIFEGYNKLADPDDLRTDGFIDLLSKFFKLQDKNVILGEIKYSHFSLPSELTDEEINLGKRIVGGCGMRLSHQVARSSEKTAAIWTKYAFELLSLEYESFKTLDFAANEDEKHAVFRLGLTEQPSLTGNDYSWMEALLIQPEEKDTDLRERRASIIKAMDTNDKEAFGTLINDCSKKQLSQMKDRYHRSLLHYAATAKDPSYLSTLLSLSPHDPQDAHGYTPIHYAAMEGRLPQLEMLLKFDLNSKSFDGSTPLIVALQNNQFDVVARLLQAGAQFTIANVGFNPLHTALHQRHLPMVNLLLNYVSKEEVNECAEEEGTPLMLACALDSVELIERLIAMGADSKASRKDGVTAIEVAIQRNSEKLLRCLLKYTKPSPQAIETAAKSGSLPVLTLLMGLDTFYQYKNGYDDSLLHICLRHGNLLGALAIIEKAPRTSYLRAANKDKETPFDLAASFGLWNVLEKLFEKKVEGDIFKVLKVGYHPVLNRFKKPGLSKDELEQALLIAAKAGNYELISHLLIPMGANIDALMGPNGWKMVHYLAKCNGLALFRKQTAKTGDLLQPLVQEGNKTLPYIAAEHGSKTVLRFLLEQIGRKEIALTNHYKGRHLFYAAIESGDIKQVQMMLDIFKKHSLAHVIVDEDLGIYPIHLAAKMGSKPIVQLLLKHQADLNIKDKKGFGPLDYAIQAKAEDLIAFLLELNALRQGNKAVSLAARNVHAHPHDPVSEALLCDGLKRKDTQKITTAIQALPPNQMVSITIDAATISGTPLQLFLRLGNKADVSAFVRGFILKNPHLNFSLQDSDGNTLAHLLISTGMLHLAGNSLDLSIANDKGQTILHLAAMNNELNKIKRLISKTHVDLVDRSGCTPLWYAIKHDHQDNVKTLILKGANLRHYDHQLLTPLMLACAENRMALIDILLENGADPNQPATVKRVFPLHFCLEMGHDPIVRSLITHGVNCNSVSSQGFHAVHFAAANGATDLIRLFEGKGISLEVKNNQGLRPIHLAAASGKRESVAALMLENNEPSTISSALHSAAANGQTETTKFLLEQHANPEIKNSKGFDTLALAASASSSTLKPLLAYKLSQNKDRILEAIGVAITYDNVDSMIALYQHGLTPHLTVAGGCTGLHLACLLGAVQCTRWFLQNQVDYLLPDPSGKTPLELAASNKSYEQFQLMLEATCAEVNLSNSKGETLLHLTAETGNLTHSMILIRKGAFLNLTNGAGQTPLHLAAREGHSELVSLLLACGADSTVKAADGSVAEKRVREDDDKTKEAFKKFQLCKQQAVAGDSLLHLAIRSQHSLAVALLAEIYEVNGQNAEGITPLDLATQTNQIRCVHALLSAGAKN